MKTIQLLSLSAALVTTTAFAGGKHDEDHSNMNHGKMDHSQMDHSQMGHSGGMSSAVGMPAPAEQATKTVEVTLSDDMRIKFAQPMVIKRGDIVRFVVTNEGKIPHEFSVGSMDEQEKHRAMMRAMPDMVHTDGSTITLQSGETADLTWHFMGQPLIEFACNIPGHAEAGMKLNAVVSN
jgi:uncharacterized cupredoxin-like copper-binding protein